MTLTPSHRNVLVVIGTRPEAIKLGPIIRELRSRCDLIATTVCLTGQHLDLLIPICEYFEIDADYNLNLMLPNQSLSGFFAKCLSSLGELFSTQRPDCVIAQGDTTTVAASSMAAFYHQVPFVHVEAGLRTQDLSLPFPEEFNRRIASVGTSLHCAPTELAQHNLLREGIEDNRIVVTGNPIVDAVNWAVERERGSDAHRLEFEWLGSQRLVLATCHRRESFGEPIRNICRALLRIVEQHPDVQCVFSVHPNPNVKNIVHEMLDGADRVRLVSSLPYEKFVFLLNRSDLILSDSGGVQEEAASLGKSLLILRDVTERPEVLGVEGIELVGTDPETVTEAVKRHLDGGSERRVNPTNPFGDGYAAKHIVDAIQQQVLKI